MFLKLLILTFIVVSSERVRYENFTVYKVYPDDVNQMKVLQNLMDEDLRLDFWTDPVPSADFVNIMAGPESKTDFESLLGLHNMKSEVAISNLQELIEKEKVSTYTRSNTRSMQWTSYYSLDDIYAWLDDLVVTYPDIVTELIGGSTYEGRLIKGIKISHGPGKRAIFLEGGIHSREWISPATLNYITDQLLTSTDPETVAAAHDFDWYIFPVTNPDGYIYSFESNRMWRKNRRPVDGTNYGIDLNRNWNNNWLVAGASTNPASDTYPGPGPFSEPETRTLSEFISSIGDQIDIYLSFHSFSQLLLLPFGNSTEPYANYDEAIKIGRRAMGALSVRYNTQYNTGNIAEAIYMATGGSVDWVKEHLKVPLVYCYELRDRGENGFLLPAEQILPNNLEAMDSILEMIHQAKRFGVINVDSGSVTLKSSFVLMVVMMVKMLF